MACTRREPGGAVLGAGGKREGHGRPRGPSTHAWRACCQPLPSLSLQMQATLAECRQTYNFELWSRQGGPGSFSLTLKSGHRMDEKDSGRLRAQASGKARAKDEVGAGRPPARPAQFSQLAKGEHVARGGWRPSSPWPASCGPRCSRRVAQHVSLKTSALSQPSRGREGEGSGHEGGGAGDC